MNRIKSAAIILVMAACLTGCAGMPENMSSSDELPCIFPDFTDISIPSNIAPLNFSADGGKARTVTLFEYGDNQSVIRGRDIRITRRKWRKMLDSGTIKVTVCQKRDNGGWISYRPFTWTVSDPVDRYVSYRLIPPSFRQYEEIILAQRDLSTFRERAFYRNSLVQKPAKGLGQCVNCHHFQNWSAENMQFHIRQYEGGTMLVTNGEPRLVHTERENGISAGVYPAWHPRLPLIAYSTNNTQQAFHTLHQNHIEVFDVESDLILYDIEHDSVCNIISTPDRMECFPNWSPDGRTLFFVSALPGEEIMNGGDVTALYNTIRYDLYSKSFDPDTRSWGETKLLYSASADSSSVTLPRVSPDGHHLMFARGGYGVFQIWHDDADLWMMDLCDSTMRPLDELNSNYAESYHSWSHDGRWVIFGTRREDAAFTRLYLSHMEEDGTFTKPFPIPQRDPHSNVLRLFSYNVPEFTTDRIGISPRRFARISGGNQRKRK